MRHDVREIARGRWADILRLLGIDAKSLTGKHAPCPKCGGTDRFRFINTDQAGTFVCNKCGGGDGFDLIQLVRGIDFRAAADEVRSVCGAAASDKPSAPGMTEEQRRKAMNELWRSGVQIEANDPVWRYLKKRGIEIEYRPDDLRVVTRCPVRGVEGVRVLPAMLAMLRGPDGKPSTLHRTYLMNDEKAPMESPRRMMPGPIAKGGCVRLWPIADQIGVAEGIETALAAKVLTGVPTYAALNAGLLEQFEPPAGVNHVVIFGDHDENFVGQAACFALAKRLCTRMRVEVKILGIEIDHARAGQDWNDALMGINHV